MSKEAVIVVDVQDCFLPGGTLATGNIRNTKVKTNLDPSLFANNNPDKRNTTSLMATPTKEELRETSKGLGEATAKFVNERPSDVLVFTSQDWHPPGHKSFASAHNGKNPMELATNFYTKDQFLKAESDTRKKRFWSKGRRQDQLLWPDHCLQDTEGSDANISSYFLNNLNPDKKSKVQNIIKGNNPGVDSYSVIATAVGQFEPYVSSPENSFKTILEKAAANLDVIYVTGIARNVCVYSSFMDILNYVTVPQFKNNNKATKVVFMYNLTRPVAPNLPNLDISPQEIKNDAIKLLNAMSVHSKYHSRLFEIIGDGSNYNTSVTQTVGGRRKSRKVRNSRKTRKTHKSCKKNHKHTRKCCKKKHRHNCRC